MFKLFSTRNNQGVLGSEGQFGSSTSSRRGSQERIRNNFEEEKARRSEKKDNRIDKHLPRSYGSHRSSFAGTIWRPKRRPKRLQVAPTRRPREDQHALKTIFGSKTFFVPKHGFPVVKFRFLKFGGSVWEFKIVPKRLQERIRNEFEEDQARRSEKKDNNDDNEATPLRTICDKPATNSRPT